MSGVPPRPIPSHSLAQRCRDWLLWFGFARLVVSAISVLLVVGGGWWLVRSPSLPVEQSLPAAAADQPTATLSPPSTVLAEVGPMEASTATTPSEIVVHVAGEVQASGVYTLMGSARIHDAIETAGGATSDGDLDGLNLAAPLADGQRIYVPKVGEVDPASVPTLSPGENHDVAEAGASKAEPININQADAAKLETLPGIGPATAQAIIDDRELNGPFASPEDLERVPGIGPSKLAQVRALVAT